MTRIQIITRLIKPAMFIALLVPLVLLVLRGITDDLGANPVETITHETGLWALRLLLLTLAITPLCKITGISEFVSFSAHDRALQFFLCVAAFHNIYLA